MSVAEENVATIRGFHEAMEAGDRATLAELLEGSTHPDCEWYPLVAEVEGGYQGREGARAFFEDFLAAFDVTYDELRIEPIAAGVLVLCRMRARGRESGIDVEQEMGIVYEFDEGRWRRGRAYPSHAEAKATAEALAGA